MGRVAYTFPMSARSRYLLWDHDGVLVDTERWYFEATRETLARIGVSLSKDIYLEYMTEGRSCWDLARAHGLFDREVDLRRAERDALYQEFLRSKPIEIEGVRAVLTALAPRHRMAIITTARRSDLEVIHSDRDLLRHFEFVLTIEDYRRAKPDPDPYLAGLARFGAQPDEALVLEDSARGLASARAAGIRCLIVQNPFTASQNFGEAWRVVDSIRDVPPMLIA